MSARVDYAEIARQRAAVAMRSEAVFGENIRAGQYGHGTLSRAAAYSKHTDSGTAGDRTKLAYGHAACKGRRKTMEDDYCAKTDLPGLGAGSGLFGVFDGHGGAHVAAFSARTVPTRLINQLRQMEGGTCGGVGGRSGLALVQSWPPVLTSPLNVALERLLPEVFCDVDATLGKLSRAQGAMDTVNCGTTASCAVVAQDHIVFANAGDSRALLSSGGRVIFATEDHKPGDQRERDRICDAGGYVLRGRVCASLAVARALGDFQFKDLDSPQSQQMVSCVPDVTFIDRNHQEDEFVLICCDGIFDVLSNDKAAAFVRDALRSEPSADLADVAGRLADRALELGSSDNLSVLIVRLDVDNVRSATAPGARLSPYAVVPPIASAADAASPGLVRRVSVELAD